MGSNIAIIDFFSDDCDLRKRDRDHRRWSV